jgi:two-component system, NtrC family, sensor kinase
MYAAQQFVVMPAFETIEYRGAIQNIDRCLEALGRDLQNLSNTTNDWASWDDSYVYLQERSKQYEVANLVDESFTNAGLDVICFLDNERQIVWGEARDDRTMAKIEVPDLFDALRAPGSPLTTPANVDDAKTGLIMTSMGPLLAASRPVITTKRQGPIRGSLVMGRFLNDEEIKGLAERTQTRLSIWKVTDADAPPEAVRDMDERRGLSGSMLVPVDRQTLRAYRTVDDVYGRPALLLCVECPRDVSAQGRMAARVATLCSLGGGSLTLLTMWILLQRGVVTPLSRMVDHLAKVGRSGNLKARLNFNRSDEIGVLASEFDRMVGNLAEYRKKVLNSAHRAGMEEVASEVLHNVGNAVNSASCSAEMLREQLSVSKVQGLERAVALLQEQRPRIAEFFSTDSRGPKWIDYVTTLNEALQQEHQEELVEVARLSDTVRHIREVIAAQQTHTGQEAFVQDVELSALIDEALLLNRELISQHGIEVDLRLEPMPELQLNKSKITQVLVNLVRNAIQAMTDAASERRLAIMGRLDGEGAVEIEIADSGCGFDDNVRTKLFTHGFTTRPDGHGFGLHYCANVLHAVGGRIAAQSAGLGKGATFRICLPNATSLAAVSG